MTDNRPVRIIPKEDAVFHLDSDGRWHNQHGVFEHPKIIAFFHASIRRDNDGFYLFQETDEYIEKVYFPYQDTALFVFDVALKGTGTLRLNTGLQIPLEPDRLFLVDDKLYQWIDDAPAKFTERCLLKLADHLQENENRFYLVLGQQRFAIPEYPQLADVPRR